MRTFCILLVLLTHTHLFWAQYTVSGTVADGAVPLAGAAVVLMQNNQPAMGQTTASNGTFQFERVPAGGYQLQVSFLGYQRHVQPLAVAGEVQLGKLVLAVLPNQVTEVEVNAMRLRHEQRGDTTLFHTAAYRVHADATAEELLKKLPGISLEGTTLKAGGEQVKRVLVDGKEFFGNDPLLAVKNLPADMIETVEVFDRQSDQARFSGFSDGNEERTLNLVTRQNQHTGRFGKVYGGYGTDGRYAAGGSLNLFNPKSRFSVVGLFNNVNQQNFTHEDLVGASGAQARGPGGIADFMTSAQEGISRTNSLGLNYTTRWGTKTDVVASYFVNQSDQFNEADLLRNYYPDGRIARLYREHATTESSNLNHRLNLRLTIQLDSMNTLLFTPRVSWQSNSGLSSLSGTEFHNGVASVRSEGSTQNSKQGYALWGDLMFRHRFVKARRTLSVRLGTSGTGNTGEATDYSLRQSILQEDERLLTNQMNDHSQRNLQIQSDITFTEPLAPKSALMIQYTPSVTFSDGQKQVYDLTLPDFLQQTPVHKLSTLIESRYQIQRGGVGYQYATQKLNFTASLQVQQSLLTGNQQIPETLRVERSFKSVLPSLMMRYKIGNTSAFRMFYRTNTSAPSVQQLSNAVDRSDTRHYSMGNPNLGQQTTHDMMLNYTTTNPETSHALFVVAGLNVTSGYLATASAIAHADSIIGNGVLLPSGTQLDRPENRNGYYSVRSMATYAMPVSWLRSNVNVNLGVNFQRKPGSYNGLATRSETVALSGGVVVGSNLSDLVDFTFSYQAGYQILQNNAAAAANYNYFNHTAQASVNYTLIRRVVFSSTLKHAYTKGLGSSYDQNALLWNAGVGFKFLQSRQAELKLNVFDLLNQNQSTTRMLSEAYVSTLQNTVLPRYAMLTFTYTLKTRSNGNRPSQHNYLMPAPPPGLMKGDGSSAPPPPPEEMM